MARKVRKVVKFGARIAAAAKSRLGRDMKKLVKSGIINRKEAQKLVKVITSEIRAEKERIKQFAKQELRRGLSKAKPLAKKALSRLRKARRKR
jgi:polyhydroxyalkanoate synthesis regulator phasin